MTLALAIAALALAGSVPPAIAADPCQLAPALRDVLQQRFGSSRVLKASDLFEDERKLFTADHPGACPGLAGGRFFGAKERAAIAILLLDVGPKRSVHLVVARPAMSSWTFFDVEEMDQGSTLVLWKAGPALYEGLHDGPKIRATNDVISLVAYEATHRVYIWTGAKFEVVWLSD